MQVKNDKVVSIHYTLTNSSGQQIDSSVGKEPLAYIQGKQNIIPGLENALEGKSKGEKLNVTIPSEEAYGERSDDMIQSVPKTVFGNIEDIQPGMQFQTSGEHGMQIITVVKVEGDNVVVDANHPLAGQALTFDVEIMDIRDASTEELEHGHTHGVGGHQH